MLHHFGLGAGGLMAAGGLAALVLGGASTASAASSLTVTGTAASKPAANPPPCASTSVCPNVIVGITPYREELKPVAIGLGANLPELTGLKWRVYDHTEAVATGTAEGRSVSCPPPYYLCPTIRRPVTVTFLHAVKGGAGRWFYSRMHVGGNVASIEIKANWAVTSRGFWG